MAYLPGSATVLGLIRALRYWPYAFELKVYTRQANTSMAVFEDDIGAIARNVSQVRAFLAEATHGAGCKMGTRPRPASTRPPLGSAR